MLKGIKGYSKKRITSLSTRGMGTAPQTATATIEMAGTRTATIATAPPTAASARDQEEGWAARLLHDGRGQAQQSQAQQSQAQQSQAQKINKHVYIKT